MFYKKNGLILNELIHVDNILKQCLYDRNASIEQGYLE